MKRNLCLLLLLLASCHRQTPAGAIDPGMATYLPPGSVLLAGVNLEALRASDLYPKLPPAIVSLLDPYRDSRSILAASNAKDILIVAGSRLAGPPDLVRAAEAQHRTGATGVPDLLADAGSVAAGKQIWIVIRGNATLPLTGNAANLNRLLRGMDFVALTIRTSVPLELALTARGTTAEAARHFADTLRATLTMTAAAEQKQSDLASLLGAIRVTRDDRQVHASLTAGAAAVQHLLDLAR